jgi:hypothetical protein
MDLKLKPFNGKKRKKTKMERVADSLAPLEEQTQQINAADEDDFQASKNLVEDPNEVQWKDLLRFEPVVLAIIIVSLCFIAFLVYNISLMPEIQK